MSWVVLLLQVLVLLQGNNTDANVVRVLREATGRPAGDTEQETR